MTTTNDPGPWIIFFIVKFYKEESVINLQGFTLVRDEKKVKYQRVLNKQDPFDQLILELGQTGVLDVSVVGIRDEPSGVTPDGYSRKAVPPRGKHSS